jgi:hypothetical protein
VGGGQRLLGKKKAAWNYHVQSFEAPSELTPWLTWASNLYHPAEFYYLSWHKEMILDAKSTSHLPMSLTHATGSYHDTDESSPPSNSISLRPILTLSCPTGYLYPSLCLHTVNVLEGCDISFPESRY